MKFQKEIIMQKIENCYVIISFIFFTGAFMSQEGFFKSFFNKSSDYSIASILILSIIYLIALLLIILRKNNLKVFLKSIFKDKWLFLLIIFAIISILWSGVPKITFLKSISLAGTIIFGIYISTIYKTKQLLEKIRMMNLLIVVISIIPYVLKISTFFDDYNNFIGFYETKSLLARALILGMIATIILLLEEKDIKRKIFWSFIIILTLLLIIGTKSFGPIFAMILTLGFLSFTIIKRKSKSNTKIIFVIISLIVIIIIGGYLLINMEKILEKIGKDTTITGRTEIWQASFEKIKEQPLLGYGFETFWNYNNPQSRETIFLLGENFTHAHNGFIQLLLDLGIIGLLLMIFSLIGTIKLAIKYGAGKNILNIWPIVYLLFFISINLTEHSLLRANFIYLLIYSSIRIIIKNENSNHSNTIRA